MTFDNQVYICKLFIILLKSFSVCLDRSQVEIEIKKRQKAEAAQDHLVNILITDMKSTISLLHVVMHLSYDFQNHPVMHTTVDSSYLFVDDVYRYYYYALEQSLNWAVKSMII